jgi:hypothetical protein
MKKIIMTAAILGLTATGALATDQNITLTATVAAFCSIDGNTTTGNARTASLTSLVTNGVVADGQSVTLSGSDSPAVCNKAASITLTSANSGLLSATSASGDFVNVIDYSASVVFGGKTASIDTTTQGAGVATSPVATDGAVAGNLAITVTTKGTPSGKYLVVGTDYADTLKVSIVPN